MLLHFLHLNYYVQNNLSNYFFYQNISLLHLYIQNLEFIKFDYILDFNQHFINFL